MAAKKQKYFIGIDLGTTNSVVAYAPINPSPNDEAANQSRIFEIEQLVGPGEVAKRPMLPSFRYHPAQGEIDAKDSVLPWDNDAHRIEGDVPNAIIGEWARELGAKTDGRQVVSAKSWLSHGKVDREADILPWGGADDAAKVSPILASASYLAYIRQAWNFEHPNTPLEKQIVVVTIPASFDEDARAYTLQAAKLAGLNDILLLEEPQAVVYDWHARFETKAENILEKIRLLMVCDVGGGTTDLSLIKVSFDKNKKLKLDRIGVGDHLMLGGDNIDLALATLAEQRLGQKKLSTAQFSQLIQQCRQVKERLLTDSTIPNATVTIMGGGSKLIGGAKRCEFTREEIEQIALNGFMPVINFDERPQTRRSAVVEFGLPYAADPAMSKHFAAFLGEHQHVCREALQRDTGNDDPAIPDAVLYNGGFFNSPLLCEQTRQLFANWNEGHDLQQLDNYHPHLAVAYGAVAYAQARQGKQLKIGGGAARSYFLHLADDKNNQAQAVSILPRGSEESEVCEIQEKTFLLSIGEPVKFVLATSTKDHAPELGELINLDDSFLSLPPLVTAIPPEKAGEKGQKSVYLSCQLTPVGTVKVECVAANNPNRRWQLEFETRRAGKINSTQAAILPVGFPEAEQVLTQVFGKLSKTAKHALENENRAPITPKNCRHELERILGEREKWDVALNRALSDILIKLKKGRRRSPAHERLWLNLTGYCLRPGFGDVADPWRIQEVWPMYEDLLSFEKETQGWIEWWTFWRRIAGGLNAEQQQEIFEETAPYADPQYLKNREVQNELQRLSYEDIIRLVGSLEHIPAEQKTETLGHLLDRFEMIKEPDVSWWALARLGARVPFYGSPHNCIEKKQVEAFLEKILERELTSKSPHTFALVLLASMSGDRSIDIDDNLREKIVSCLEKIKAPDVWVARLKEVTLLDEQDAQNMLGENLPVGLRLNGSD